MATLKSIAEAIGLIDAKKESLRKAFEDLQAQSSQLSSFSLSWSDINSHFASIEASISQKFKHLESLESARQQQLQQQRQQQQQGVSESQPEPRNSPDRSEAVSNTRPESDGADAEMEGEEPLEDAPSRCPVEPVEVRPELKSLCAEMDSMGLRKYVSDHLKERDEIRAELLSALGLAPEPGRLVLDGMVGFYSDEPPPKGDKDREIMIVRRNCVFLLEVLVEARLNVSDEVRESAKMVALDWKGKVSKEGRRAAMEALGFLNLVAAYGLMSEVSVDEILDLCVHVAHFGQASKLCRILGLEDSVPELIQKLISRGKHPLAVKFIFDFGLTEKFPPVPLLKTYVTESTKLSKKISKDGNNSRQSQKEAMAKEISVLKSVIKVIEERKLDSEYPHAHLKMRVEELEKLKADKRPASAPAAKPRQQQQQKQKGKQKVKPQLIGQKRPRPNASVGTIAAPVKIVGSTSAVPTFQQSHLQSASLADLSSSYMIPTGGPYSLVGTTPGIASYAGPSSGLYSLSGVPLGFSGGDPSPARPFLYPSESQVPRSAAYGGYGVSSQHHPSYYAQ